MIDTHKYAIGTLVRVIKEWSSPGISNHQPIGTTGVIVEHDRITGLQDDPLYIIRVEQKEQHFSENNVLKYFEFLLPKPVQTVKYYKNTRYTLLMTEMH